MTLLSKVTRPISILIGALFLFYGVLGVIGFNPGGGAAIGQRLLAAGLFPLGAAYLLSDRLIFSRKELSFFCLHVRALVSLLLLALYVSGFFGPDGTLPFMAALALTFFSLAGSVAYGMASQEDRP